MGRWKAAVAIAATVVLGVAVFLSVRDGGGHRVSADERFVDSLCEAAREPGREMLELIDRVRHTRASPGREYGWNLLYHHALSARFLALEYRRRVRAIEPPDTPAGAKAAEVLDHVADDPLEDVRDMISRIRALPRNLSLEQSIRSLNRLESDLLFPIAEMDGGPILVTVAPELTDEYQTAESCKKLDAELAEGPIE